MCDCYEPCECLRAKWRKPRKLTLLLLDCWQREYGRRPYRHFIFERLDFEERMGRPYHPERDGAVVVRFIAERSLCRVRLLALNFLPRQAPLLDELCAALCRLRTIELHHMQLPAHFFRQLHVHAGRLLVQELSLAATPLTYDDVQQLYGLLLQAPHIHTLDVYNCGLDHIKFALLADGVHKCGTLRSLNCGRLCGGHQLTLETTKVAHIVAALLWQNKLTELRLGQCEFVARDMELIAEYLYDKQARLRTLDLSCNIIAADGVEYLLRAVSASGSLRWLDISSNGLGTHGGMVVVKYLASCYQLEHLNLRYNEIDADTVNRILTSMKKPLPLQQLKLYGNAFDERSAHILRRLLDAGVVPQDAIDITVTLDEMPPLYRIIPYY